MQDVSIYPCLMNDDGPMARLPELISFAQLHGLKVGTISDLIAYRRKHDKFLERRIEKDVQTLHGDMFKAVVFKNQLDGAQHVAFVKGTINSEEPCLVRVHRVDFLEDVVGITTQSQTETKTFLVSRSQLL